MKKESSLTVLATLAKKLKKPVKSCQIIDPNTDQIYQKEAIFSSNQYRIRIAANETMIFIWVQGFRSPLAFAINREDNISMLKDHCPFSFGKKQLPIFIDKGILQILQTNIEVVRSYLSKVDIREKIEFLDLQSNESIHFSGGGIILYYKQRPLHDLLNALDILYFLADRLPRVKSEKVDLSKLPVEFHSLVPLIEKFSISDDDLRNDKLKKTPAEEKKKLHQIVKPVLPRINVYLDSFGNNPLSEEAALLMHLAEAVAELEMTNNKDN